MAVIGGAKRQEYLEAIAETWGSLFSRRLFVTDEDVLSRPDFVNAFPGLTTQEAQLRATLHPEHPYWEQLARGEEPKYGTYDAAWFISQAKYLIGLERLRAAYPDSEYYVLADSDTFIFPFRLAEALGLFGKRDPDLPIAMGMTFRVHLTEPLDEPDVHAFNILLGGAGVVLSRGALAAMNVSRCVELQRASRVWNAVPSDWRLGLCLSLFGIKREPQFYMYQSNERLNCKAPHGPNNGTPGWAGLYQDTMSPCPLSLHYQYPETMRRHYTTAVLSPATCIPAWTYGGSTECNCFPKRGAAAGAAGDGGAKGEGVSSGRPSDTQAFQRAAEEMMAKSEEYKVRFMKKRKRERLERMLQQQRGGG